MMMNRLTENDLQDAQESALPLILVVDDDQTMRSLLRRAMEKEGYQVSEARDGEECLASYQRLHPNVILLDAVMPVVDGFTCCARLRSLPGGDRVPVLMITSLEDKYAPSDAGVVGVTDFIPKPINWVFLRDRVRHFLREKARS